MKGGITLVALIITVIILVILAAVTIITLQHSKMIEYAVEGAQKYELEQQNEMNEIAGLESLIENTLDKLKDNNTGNAGEGEQKTKFIIRLVDETESSSSNTVYVPNNVVLQVFTDSTCNNLFQEIEVTNGKWESNTVPQNGTYFVKIKNMPTGYKNGNEINELVIKDVKENIWTIKLQHLTIATADTQYSGNGDYDLTVNINIRYADDSSYKGDDVQVLLYKIAEVGETDLKYHYTDDFSSYGEQINKINEIKSREELLNLANLLQDNMDESIAPVSALLMQDGLAEVTDLPCGAYLVVVEQIGYEGEHNFVPNIIMTVQNGTFYTDIDTIITYKG